MAIESKDIRFQVQSDAVIVGSLLTTGKIALSSEAGDPGFINRIDTATYKFPPNRVWGGSSWNYLDVEFKNVTGAVGAFSGLSVTPNPSTLSAVTCTTLTATGATIVPNSTTASHALNVGTGDGRYSALGYAERYYKSLSGSLTTDEIFASGLTHVQLLVENESSSPVIYTISLSPTSIKDRQQYEFTADADTASIGDVSFRISTNTPGESIWYEGSKYEAPTIIPLVKNHSYRFVRNGDNYYLFADAPPQEITPYPFFEMQDPTGFVAPEDVVVSYDGTTRKVTLTGDVRALWRGVSVPQLFDGWESEAHASGTGTFFLYFDGTNFYWDTTSWSFSHLMIAMVFRDGVNVCLRECHGLMDWRTHQNLHESSGTYLRSGGDLSSFTLNSTTATNRRPQISEAIVVDEDLATILPALNTNAYTLFRLDGAGAVSTETIDSLEIVRLNAGVPRVNVFSGGVWTEIDLPNNHYAKLFLMAIPASAGTECQKRRFAWIQPQTNSATLATIRAITPASISLGTIQIAVPEFVFIAEVILRRQGGNWTLIEVNKITGNSFTQTSQPVQTGVQQVLEGAGISVDNTNPQLPEVSLKVDFEQLNSGLASSLQPNGEIRVNSRGEVAVEIGDIKLPLKDKLVAGTNVTITQQSGGPGIGERLVIASSGGGGGSSTFIGLTDTPANYSGQNKRFVRVNSAENGLEFATDTINTMVAMRYFRNYSNNTQLPGWANEQNLQPDIYGNPSIVNGFQNGLSGTRGIIFTPAPITRVKVVVRFRPVNKTQGTRAAGFLVPLTINIVESTAGGRVQAGSFLLGTPLSQNLNNDEATQQNNPATGIITYDFPTPIPAGRYLGLSVTLPTTWEVVGDFLTAITYQG